MEEIWKDILGYEGLYQVSNFGRIKSTQPRYKTEKILKTHMRTNGYIFIGLHKDKKIFSVDVHRLVAQAFVENKNPKENKYVLHLDDNPTNNVYTNLKWGTQKENCNTIHHLEALSKSASLRIGDKNSFYGKKHTEETKQKIAQAKSVKVKYDNIIFNSIKECADYIGVSSTTIRRHLKENKIIVNNITKELIKI